MRAILLFIGIMSCLHAGPPVISGIKAMPGTTTATISWTTDIPATAVIFYGPTTKYGMQTAKLAAATQHTQAIIGLAPGTVHYYKVRVEGPDGAAAFSTPRQVTTKKEMAVTSIAVEPDDQGVLSKGHLQFTATIKGTGAFDPNPKWASTGGYINRYGLLTAPATPGSYTITATSRNNPGVTAKVTFRVVRQFTAVELVGDKSPMKPGEERTFWLKWK